jgi:aminopeptidase 2
MVFNLYQKGDSVDARLAALGALGAINDISLVHRILDEITLNQEVVKPQDVMRPVGSLAHLSPFKAQVLEILWKWCIKNWDLLHEQLAASLSLLGRVLQTCISSQTGDEFVQTVEAWVRGDDLKTPEEKAKRTDQLKAAKRPLEQGLEKVKSVTSWIKREDASVKAWVKSASA